MKKLFNWLKRNKKTINIDLPTIHTDEKMSVSEVKYVLNILEKSGVKKVDSKTIETLVEILRPEEDEEIINSVSV